MCEELEETMNNPWNNHKLPPPLPPLQANGSNVKPKKTLGSLTFIIGLGLLGIFLWIFFDLSTPPNSSTVTSNTAFSPKECDYLTDQGFPTNSYHRQDEDNYICLSNYIDIGEADSTGIESTMDYAVEGTSKDITDIYLRGSYTNQSSQPVAQQIFLTSSKSLILQITGQQIPQELMHAIKEGKKFKGNINGKKIHLERLKHAGYGYTQVLTVFINPKLK